MTAEKVDVSLSKTCESSKVPYFGYRYIQCLLVFLCHLTIYSIKTIPSVAIISMTDNSANPDFEVYPWTISEISYVLSSCLWGYTVVLIPSSFLVKNISSKIVVITSICVCSILSLLTPIGAKFGGWQLVCVMRAISGACEALSFSSIYLMFGLWIPPIEREYLIPICFLGGVCGIFILLGVGSSILTSVIGWPGLFYIFGSFGLIVAILWCIFGFNRPAECKFISQEEREYIEGSLANLDNSGMIGYQTPLRRVLCSFAYFSTVIAQSATSTGNIVYLTEIPAFITGVYGKNIASSAFLSALPFMGMALMTVVFVIVNTIISKRRPFSLLIQRKMYNTIAEWLPAGLLIILAYIPPDNVNVAIGLLTIAVSCTAAQCFGSSINYVELSPPHASILFGVANTIATALGLLAPIIVGVVVTDPSNFDQWRIIFWITAAFYFKGNLWFLIFGRVNKI